MDAISSVVASQKANLDAQIQMGVMSKVMNSQADLAMDMLNKMLASVGIGANLNMEA